MHGTTRALVCLAGLVLLVLVPAGDAAADGDGWTLRLLPRRVLAQPREEGPIRDPAALRKRLTDAKHTLVGSSILTLPQVTRAGKSRPSVLTQQAVLWNEMGRPASLPGIVWIRQPASLVLERNVPTRGIERGTFPSDLRAVLAERKLEHTGRFEYEDVAPEDTHARERVFVRPRGRVDIGLYTDDGAHSNAVRTAAAACFDAGLSLRPLTAAQLNDGSFADQVRCLLMPGGWAEPYTHDIGPQGVAHVRRFVERGGGYVGICAGAFYACATIRWEGDDFDYPLDLVQAKAVGSLHAIAPWPKHALADLELDRRHPLAKGLEAKRKAFYLGGCALELASPPKDGARVVARYAKGGQPAVVTFKRRRGRVFLSGVHLEYDLTSARDDLTWPESEGMLKDPEADWDLLQRGVLWTLRK